MALYGGIQITGHPDLENIRRLDMLPVPMVRRMQRLGIAIDVPYFNDLTIELGREMGKLRDDIAWEIPPEKLDLFCNLADQAESEESSRNWSPINVESGDQLAKLLYDVLSVGKGKQLKLTTGGNRLSTGKKQLELLKKDHPVVQLILDYRERSKLVTTYTSKLPRIAKLHPKGPSCPICECRHYTDTWRVHTEFTSTRTDTGRFASKRPNLQNIPARTALGRKVRAGFIASPGTLLVSRDFSQIELRLLAHCAVEQALISIFLKGQDPHLITAMRTFGITDPARVDKLLHRAPCKNVNFGVVYGLSASGLYDLMALTYAVAGKPMPKGMDQDWCQQFIDQWFDLYPEVKAYMEIQFYRARRYGVVWDIFGRIRRVPEVQSCLSRIKGAGLRQAGNMGIQSSGAGLMKLAMGEVEEVLSYQLETGIWCWPLLTIHDELIVEVEEDYADAVCELMGDVMNLVTTDKKTGKNLSRVPILSDGHPMERWVKE